MWFQINYLMVKVEQQVVVLWVDLAFLLPMDFFLLLGSHTHFRFRSKARYKLRIQGNSMLSILLGNYQLRISDLLHFQIIDILGSTPSISYPQNSYCNYLDILSACQDQKSVEDFSKDRSTNQCIYHLITQREDHRQVNLNILTDSNHNNEGDSYSQHIVAQLDLHLSNNQDSMPGIMVLAL